MKEEERCPWCKSACVACRKNFEEKITRRKYYACGNCRRVGPGAMTRKGAMLKWQRQRELWLDMRQK